MCVRVDSCCCGCSVRHGAVYLAATYTAFGVLAIVTGAIEGDPYMASAPVLLIVMNILLLVGVK